MIGCTFMMRLEIKYIVFVLGMFSCDYFQKNDTKSNPIQAKTPLEMELSKLSDRLIDSPKNAFLYFQRGKLHWQNYENEKALNDFYKMVSYDSTKPIYYETLADFFVQNANIERGINALDYAIPCDAGKV